MESFYEDYTRLEELGQGGFATVYKVRHNKLDYIRAIRVLNKPIAQGEQDPTYKKFLDECRLLLRLGNGCHPNIVRIYRPLLRSQQALVEMDFIKGEDLSSFIAEQQFVEINEVITLAKEIGNALAYCHVEIYKYCMDRELDNLSDDPNDGRKVLMDCETKARLIKKYRVIHNDIHSGNIMRGIDGRFVLLDFGLSIEGEDVIRKSRRENGAPEFKAPEKWDGDNPTTQSDIYSFGVVLYEMLTGRVPFVYDKSIKNSSEAEFKLSKAHKDAIPEPIIKLRGQAFEKKNPGQKYKQDYPDWLEKLIMKCLEKEPSKRFRDGKELYEFITSKSNNLTEELLAEKQNNKQTVKVVSPKRVQIKKTNDKFFDTNILIKKSENSSKIKKWLSNEDFDF